MAKLRAERLHAWEKRLTLEQEERLLGAVGAWRDAGHDLLVHHEAGKIDVLEPPAVVSLYALTDRFLADANAVHATLDRWCTTEEPSASLVLRPSFGDDPQSSQIATHVSSMLTGANPVPDGFEGATHDDRRGTVELSVRVAKATNTLCIDLARVLDRVRAAQQRDPEIAVAPVVRQSLRAMVDGAPGALWTRDPATHEERAIARRCLDATNG